MIPSRRTAAAKNGNRFSEEIMIKEENEN